MWRLIALTLALGAAMAEPEALVVPMTNTRVKTYVKNVFTKSGSTQIPCSQAIRDGGYPEKGDLPFPSSITRRPAQGACAIFRGNPRWLVTNAFWIDPREPAWFFYNEVQNTYARSNLQRFPYGPGWVSYEVVRGVETRNGTLWYITIGVQI